MAMPEQTDEILKEIEANTRDTATAAATTAAATTTAADTLVAATESVSEATTAAEAVAFEARTGRRTIDAQRGPTIVTPAGQMVAAPTSTEEEDRNTAGQRHVNLIWENTQRQVALAVILTSIIVAGYLSVWGTSDSQTAAMVFLFGVANLVTGFYFGRSNHQRIGGVSQGR